MESSYTEAVSASLVREFLSRKVRLLQNRNEIIRSVVFTVLVSPVFKYDDGATV
jgi:hypothetical protein